jgi:thiol-disulfide isomerase/thioredoxin
MPKRHPKRQSFAMEHLSHNIPKERIRRFAFAPQHYTVICNIERDMMTCLSTSTITTTTTMLVLQVLLIASLSMTTTTTTAFAFAPSVLSVSSSSLSSSTNSKSFLQRQPSSSLLLQRRRSLVAVSSTAVPTAPAATVTTETPTSSSSFPPANARPVITKITSEAQLTAYLNNNGAAKDNHDNRVTVLQFHAAWCKSCQKFGRLYHKLAVDHADWERIPPKLSRVAMAAAASNTDTDSDSVPQEILKEGNVRMASIEFGANSALCRSLGITKLPTVHFYKGPVKLAGFAAGPNKIQMVRDTMEHYIEVSDTELEFENDMQQGEQLVQDAIRMPPSSTATANTVSNEDNASSSSSPRPSNNLWAFIDQWKR